MTSSGIEPATFLLVAQCFNQLRHRVPLEWRVLRKSVAINLKYVRHDRRVKTLKYYLKENRLDVNFLSQYKDMSGKET